MPRVYKPNRHGKQYAPTDLAKINEAKVAVQEGLSIRAASTKFGVAYSVLQRRLKNPDTKTPGGQTTLSLEEEAILVERIVLCAEWGYPIDSYDLRLIVKGFLDRRGKVVPKFKNNLPGRDFAMSFLKRHKDKLSERMCQNIKRCRAAISRATINEYFDNLEKSLDGVPPENIVNYDETNLTDDPGRKKVIFKRGVKYPERIMNQSKSSTSVMFAASGSGVLLPCYVVYRASHLYSSWTEAGPQGTRFNRTKSGWFDSCCFDDWVKTIAIPYLKPLPGKKILIGDNLSSHLSVDAIKMCHDHQISFVFLPTNATHLTQPLDVAFFRPVKIAWRTILLDWKKGPGRRESSVPKDVFPRLLKKLMCNINENADANIKAGFCKCGINPLNRDKVLQRMPREPQEENVQGIPRAINDSLVAFLQTMRHEDPTLVRKNRKKIGVHPGQSVGLYGNHNEECTASSEADSDVDSPSTPENNSTEEMDDSPLEEREDVTASQTVPTIRKFNRTFTNVLSVGVEEIEQSDWLLVSFSPEATKAGPSKLLYFIGKVLHVSGTPPNKNFRGTFLRSKSTRDHNGLIYTFPEVPDVCSFSFDQVVGKMAAPEELRRGQLKFQINNRSLI